MNLSAETLDMLRDAGFELTTPLEYDCARGPLGAIRVQAIGTRVTTWLGAWPSWESSEAVRRALCCAACGQPLGEGGVFRDAVRVSKTRIEVFSYHDGCKPSESPSQ